MKAIEAAGERVCRRARDNVLLRLEHAARETLPRDVNIERGDGELRFEAARLRGRSATDPRLRMLGLLARERRG